MIHTFLFDMGNVLVHFSHEKMFQQIGALYNRTEAEIRSLSVETGIMERYERGQLTDTEYHQELESHVEGNVTLAELLYATSNIFQLNDDIMTLLDQLKTGGYRLVLLSNTCSAHIVFIQKEWSLLDRFDDVVLSYQEGALKPEPKIYEAALQKINCQPEEACFIDDIPENITHARQHGLQGIQFVGTTALAKTIAEKVNQQ